MPEATIPYGLTLRQATRPHASVQHANYGSLSVLERSFSRGSLEEIEYWDRKGVLDEALSGKSSSKRDYTRTLMGYLTKTHYQHSWGDQADRWDAILRKLWDAGAHKHVDKHGEWIHGLTGHWLFDVLIESGVSPFHSDSRYSAPLQIIFAIVTHQSRREDGRPRLFEPRNVDIDLLCSQLEQCIEFPAANDSNLSGLLAQVVVQGIKRLDQGRWLAWRDRLLERGANPLINDAHVLSAFSFAGPEIGPVSRHDLRDIDPSVEIDKSKPPTQAEIDLSMAQRAKRDHAWVESSSRWLDALVPYIQKHATPDKPHPMSTGGWTGLLDQPNGVELCRRILDAGVTPPWVDSQQSSSMSKATDILGQYGSRNPSRLEKLVELLHGRQDQANQGWIRTIQASYVANKWVNDPSKATHDDRVEDYSRKKSAPWRPGHQQNLSHSEWTHLLALSSWAIGQPLPQSLFDVLSRLPANPGPEGLDADLAFLVKKGVLAQALSRSTSTESDLHRVDSTTYNQWFDGWMQDAEVFDKVIALAPHLHWPMLAIAVQIASHNYDPAVRQKWFTRLQSDFPENAKPVFTQMFNRLAASPRDWVSDRWEGAALDLVSFGATPTPEAFFELASKTFEMAGSATAERQVEMMQFLVDVGVDIKTQGPVLIETELQRELQAAASSIKTESRKPAIMALLKAGADASLLDLGRSSLPLHEFVRINASSVGLDACTVAHTSGPRPVRF